MAVRNILHIDKLEAFEEFLRFEGYMILPLSKNPYEVLRAKKGRDTVIIYRRSEAKEHLSVMDKDYGLDLPMSVDAEVNDYWYGENLAEEYGL